jgi:hypothetical protein
MHPFKRFLVGCVLAGSVAVFSGCDLEYSDIDEEPSQQEIEQAQKMEEAASTSTPSSSTSSAGGGGGGFLWKPVSEGDGKLVVLLPSSLTGKVNGCSLSYSGGSESGRNVGVHNGNREHFRYSKPGAGYGQNIRVTASLKDGTTQSWTVPNGASRTTF